MNGRRVTQSPSRRNQQGKWLIGLQRPGPTRLIIQLRPCPSSQLMLESLWGWPYGPKQRSWSMGLIKPCPSLRHDTMPRCGGCDGRPVSTTTEECLEVTELLPASWVDEEWCRRELAVRCWREGCRTSLRQTLGPRAAGHTALGGLSRWGCQQTLTPSNHEQHQHHHHHHSKNYTLCWIFIFALRQQPNMATYVIVYLFRAGTHCRQNRIRHNRLKVESSSVRMRVMNHCCIPTPTTDSNTSTSMIWVTVNMCRGRVPRTVTERSGSLNCISIIIIISATTTRTIN